MRHNLFLDGYPLQRSGRWLLAAWVLFLVSGFALARSLEPSPRGYGTHQQLGLPPCTFRMLVGIPCPSCGMTTAFSHFMHFDLVGCCRANPAGLLLALFCAIQIPWGIGSVFAGRLLGVHRPADTALIWMVALMAAGVLHWIYLLVLQFRGVG